IDILSNSDNSKSQVIQLLQAVNSGDSFVDNITVSSSYHQSFDYNTAAALIYIFVSLTFLIAFIQTLLLIRRLIKTHKANLVNDIYFVNSDAKGTPFSFLRFIFWNKNIDINSSAGKQVFSHEVAHVQEGHTFDKLFMNIVMIFFWSNPFYWLLRKELYMIHEFIADQKAVQHNDTAAFAEMILATAYPNHQYPIANSFFYSPIKRRILMLSKSQNPKANYFGRILVLPLAALVFAAFTLKTKQPATVYQGRPITVVIDAGHGGTDNGALSADGKSNEKDINLAIAKAIGELNNNDRIRIVLSRNDDAFSSVQDRVKFSNEQNADLFISIHVDGSPVANSRSGLGVWMSKDNKYSAKSAALASQVIATFQHNYTLPVEQEIRVRQKGIYVLSSTSCPAVLIETAVINNDKDLSYLSSTAGKQTIAKNILSAIEKFAASDNFVAENAIVTTDTIPVKSAQPITASRPADVIRQEQQTIPDVTTPSQTIHDPLYVINKEVSTKQKVNAINPNDIESINVLKGPEATKLYGDNGKNGVIMVTTKPNAKSITGDRSSQMNANTSARATDATKTTTDQVVISDGKTFTAVEKDPAFPGNQEGWAQYLRKHLDAL
ncbi:MAG TPA: N-acetylmuramoyl-L-alanine amidase, partial [Ferruginibacter sp.]|nr:N-acetylmuramoyl-L-alanine amidase [Ferruginibacter sp.]